MTFYDLLKRYRISRGANISINNINYDKKFIFIHIPKTAGTSLRVALKMPPFDHFTIQYFKNNYSIEFNQFKKFAFVRHPVSRFVSLYNYARMEESYYHSAIKPEKSIAGKHPFFELSNELTIEEFIEFMVAPENSLVFESSQFLPQSNWVLINGSNCLDAFDFIGKYENIITDSKNLSKLINCEINLPHLNKSSNSHESIQLSRGSISLLESYYTKDYDLFNY